MRKKLYQLSGKIRTIFTTKLHPYQVLTILLLSFVAGVFAAKYLDLSWQASWPVFVLIMLLLLFASLLNFLLGNKWLVVAYWMSLSIFAGLAIYSYKSQEYFCSSDISANDLKIKGVVINNPLLDYKNQEVIIESGLCEGKNIRILVKLPHYPALDYGDQIELNADLQKPGLIEAFDYAKYLKPKLVSYLALNPHTITVVSRKNDFGTRATGVLYSFKNNFEYSLSRNIAEPEASLAVGIITGSKRNIPESLSDNLNAAGLTHIIALSGFNVTIIVAALASLLASFFSRRKIFWIGSILVVAFI